MASIIGVETLQHTNGTTAATLTTSGGLQASKVYPSGLLYWPSFQARKTSGGNQTGLLTFATVDFDKGNNFTSGAAAKFTAPVTGVYYFAYSAVKTTQTTGGTVVLVKNGSDTQIIIYSGNPAYSGLTLAGALELNATDYVQIKANIEVQEAYGSWTGFLVTAT